MVRVRCVPQEGSAGWRAFSDRPKDPVWSNRSLLERTRKALKAYDSYLDLWWSPTRRFHSEIPGRWRIVCFMPNAHVWDTVQYWEGESGEYRDPSPEGCLIAAQRCDMWARDTNLSAVSKKVDGKNDAVKERAEASKFDEVWNDSVQYADAMVGKKRHYDMAPR